MGGAAGSQNGSFLPRMIAVYSRPSRPLGWEKHGESILIPLKGECLEGSRVARDLSDELQEASIRLPDAGAHGFHHMIRETAYGRNGFIRAVMSFDCLGDLGGVFGRTPPGRNWWTNGSS